MSKKITGIIILIIGFLLLAGLIYGFFLHKEFFMGFLNRDTSFVNVDNGIGDNVNKNIIEEKPILEKEVKEVKIVNPEKIVSEKEENSGEESIFRSAKDDLKRLSVSFVERFGSYSNQSNYSNLNHLMIFMSAKMREWALDFIQKSKMNRNGDESYYGINTKVVQAEILEYDEDLGNAKILVHTRRKESRANNLEQEKVFSQDIDLSFVKERGVWKVDSAYWQ